MKTISFFKFKLFILFFIFSILTNQLVAQTNGGIFFQAVARDNYSNPAKNRDIYLQSSIIQTSLTGDKVLVEEHRTKTDVTGMFSISLGNGVRISGTASGLNSIDWSNGPFYLNLKVAITPIYGDNGWDYTKEWIDMGTTSFGAVPYALYAANASGVNQKVNITDTTQMLSVYAKAMTVQSLSTTVDTKLSVSDTASMLNPYIRASLVLDSAFINTELKSKADTADVNTALALKANTTDVNSALNLKANTADVTTSLNLKANTADVNTALNLKANTADVTTSLNLKANTIDVNTSLATKVDKVTGKDLSTNDYTTAEKTKLAAITGTNTGDQDLSALATTANVTTSLALKANTTDVNTSLGLKANTTDVNTALNLKANTADITTSLNLKANTTDVNTSLATKVDKVTGKDLSTNDYTTAEKTKLAAITGTNTGDQDLSALATNTALALKANTTDVNTALNSKANTADVTTSLNLKANTIDVNTSLATKVDKVTGKDLSTNDYTTAEKTKLAAITGTNTGDQTNITGNAATATKLATAKNINGVAFDGSADITITATANAGTLAGTTLASNVVNSSLTSVGTLTSGTISLTTDMTTSGNLKAGSVTYPNTHGTNGQVLSTTGSGTLSWTSIPTPDLTNYVTTNTTQTITSAKTFSETTTFSKDLAVNGITVGRGGGNESTNTAIGTAALTSNTTGNSNIAVGMNALLGNITGSYSTAIGLDALRRSTGGFNTAFGAFALDKTTTGVNNTAIGPLALEYNETGSLNTAIGFNAGVSSSYKDLTNTTAIGNGARVTASNTIQLGNTSVTNVNTSGTITAAGMGLGVSTPNASAALDVTTTTKGFLPPRLTTTQRDAITTPAEGLTVWNTTNKQLEVYDGVDWVNMLGNKGPNLKVGDSYGGGIIAHIFTKGETGYVAKEIHGLIAATSDQSTGIQWRNGTNSTTGATGQAIGTGLANTNTIITSQGPTATSYAAGIARAHNGGGFTDWFLPSRFELATLYLNRGAIGGFSTNSYHSSSEFSSSQNYMQDFNNGFPATGVKSFAASVRAVRTF